MNKTVNILAVGDICGQSGLDILAAKLRVIIRQYDIGFTIANGENANGLGISPKQAEQIRNAGVDMITLGNHTWARQGLDEYLDNNKHIVRPANFAPQVPGYGYRITETNSGKICVINLIGRVEVNAESENPFLEADKILKTLGGGISGIDKTTQNGDTPDIIFVDFHASATSEKTAMAYHLDGRVSALWGTHTHVQTSDARILSKGTGYITDLGMTGPYDSVIGMKPEQPLSNFLGNPPERFVSAQGDSRIEGAVFGIDTQTGKCVSVEAVRIE